MHPSLCLITIFKMSAEEPLLHIESSLSYIRVIMTQLGAAANKLHTEVWALKAAYYPNVWMIAGHIGLLSTTDLHSDSYLRYCTRRVTCSSEYFAMTSAYTGNTIPQGFSIFLAFSTVCSLPLLVQSLLLSHLYKLVSDWISNLLTDRIIDIMCLLKGFFYL